MNEHEQAEQHHTAGRRAFAQGDYQTAIEHFSQALQLRSDYSVYYIKRALAHHALADYPSAIGDLSTASQFTPRNGRIYYRRSLVYLDAGEYEQAVMDMEKAHKLMQAASQPAFWLKMLNRALGRSERRNVDERRLEEAIRTELSPCRAELTNAKYALYLQNATSAQKHYRLALGKVCGDVDDLREELADLARLARLFPHNAQIPILRGWLEVELLNFKG